MAVGDDAVQAGFSLVPESGEEGRVRWGARELNRTRDFIAQVKALIPTSKTQYQKAAGINVGDISGPSHPGDGSQGNIVFQKVPDGVRIWFYWDGAWHTNDPA